MGDVSTDAHPSGFAQIRVPVAFLTKPGMFALQRNRLHLKDVTLSMLSLLVVLHDLSPWF